MGAIRPSSARSTMIAETSASLRMNSRSAGVRRMLSGKRIAPIWTTP